MTGSGSLLALGLEPTFTVAGAVRALVGEGPS